MEVLALQQPELIGKDEELSELKQHLDNAIAGKGSTIFISGEAGIGKTRIVTELIKDAESKNAQVIQGWCLAESLEPLMPVKTGLREAGLAHLISGAPPPFVVSAYLINQNGMLIAQAERGEMDLDSDIFAGMLQAVGNFVQDSLAMMTEEGKGGLNSLGYQDYTILIQAKGEISLAIVIRGEKCEFLVDDMKALLDETAQGFEGWTGDMSTTTDVRPKVAWFVESGKYDGKFLVDDPKIKQENLFDNVLLGIQRASYEKPVLLFLDDLQWSDPTTMNLVHYLSRNTKDNKVLILGTYRPEDIIESDEGKPHQLETAMQGMSREGLFEKIELKRLGLEDTEKIIISALGKVGFDKKFYKKIFHETEGTPFFILEVVKLLVEDRAIAQDEQGIWQQTKDLDEIDIPSKVYDVVKRRLDRLIKEQRKILDCASVIGEEFQSVIIGNAMGLNKFQLLENLSEIEKNHKLIHYLKDKYRFDHAKVKEVLYNGIGEELRREYHRIIADTIAELHKDNPDDVVSDLAYHYFEAGDGRAGEYLVKAGDTAKEEYANEESIRLYNNALTFLKDDKELIHVRENLGDIYSLAGEVGKAIENFEKVKEATDENETKARMLRKISGVHENMGEFDRSLEMLVEAKELVEERTAEYGRILFGEGYVHWKKGEYDKAMQLFQRGIKTFEETEAEQKDVGDAFRAVGNIHWAKGEYDLALEYDEKSLAVMERIGEQSGIATALNNIGLVYSNRGDLDRALEYLEQGLEIREKIGDKSGIGASLNNIGLDYSRKGELEKAVKYYERSLEIIRKIRNKHVISTLLNNIGLVYSNRGQLDKALEYYAESLEIAEEIGIKRGIAMALNNIGSAHYNKGELDKALKNYEQALEIKEKIGDKQGVIYSCCGLADTYLELKNIQSGFEYATKAVEISLEIGAKAEEGMSRQMLGKVYRENKDWDKAIVEFERAQSILEEVGYKKIQAMTFYEYGILWKAKGEPVKAKEYLKKALEVFELMSLKLWEEKCKKALEEL